MYSNRWRFLLLCIIASFAIRVLAGALPTGPAITPGPIAILRHREAAPSFTGVSIADPSIPPVTIPPVSIPPLSLDLPSSTCTPTIKPDKYGYVPPDECDALWNYSPSFSAAIAFSVLFGALLVFHLGQAVIYKKKFCWVICMAALWEFGSYLSRVAAAHNQQSVGLATISQLLVLLAPLWVNAFDYMLFSRAVHFYSPAKKVARISPSILAIVFVTLDVFSFIIQLVGGSMAGPGADPQSMLRGVHIYMGGIGLQEFFITVFLGLIVKFHLDMLKADKLGQLSGPRTRWRGLLYCLYGSLVAITVRIIFRLIEFSRGFGLNNPIPYRESYFYGLEAFPMLVAIFLWNIAHPGRFMQGPDSELPPSWIGRKLRCCCHRRKSRCDGRQRLTSSDAGEEPKPSPREFPQDIQGEELTQTTHSAYNRSTHNARLPQC